MLTPRHTSDLELTRVLVFLKQSLAIMSLMTATDLDLLGEEIKDYCKFGDMPDKQAGELLSQVAKLYREEE